MDKDIKNFCGCLGENNESLVETYIDPQGPIRFKCTKCLREYQIQNNTESNKIMLVGPVPTFSPTPIDDSDSDSDEDPVLVSRNDGLKKEIKRREDRIADLIIESKLLKEKIKKLKGTYICECGLPTNPGGKTRHLNTAKHKAFLAINKLSEIGI